MGLTKNLRTLLRERAVEIIEAFQGPFTAVDVIAELRSAGDVTNEMLGSQLGDAALKSAVVDPVIRAKDDTGQPFNLLCGTAKWIQRDFADYAAHVFQYHHKRNHAVASAKECETFRLYIMDRFGRDPLDEPDPTSSETDESVE